jgi:hypothetical protein
MPSPLVSPITEFVRGIGKPGINRWRGVMQNWLAASAIITAYLLAAAQIAGGSSLALLLPQNPLDPCLRLTVCG